MPLYEYRCDSCDKVREVMQKFSDAPLSNCPDCQSPVQKLMSLSSFSLKGTGWYTTDYKRASSSGSSDAGSKPAAGKEASACAGGEKSGAGTCDKSGACSSN
jgi:putative FmdB family regulatory protein